MTSVNLVVLNADAFYTCLTHALSNEQEEVMGLCIGEIKDVDFGCEIYITATLLLRRLDKRKDRVEISVEQLSNASTKVEELAKSTGRNLRIVGWYHSHPHITVWPSHVDISTQAMYQMMDRTFVGLIFSCFNENKSNHQSVHLTCFQSVENSSWNAPQGQRIDIPIVISPCESIGPACLDALKELPKILMQEESDTYEAIVGQSRPAMDLMTQLYNSTVHVQSLCKLNNTILLPLLQVTQSVTLYTKSRAEQIEKDNKQLKTMIADLNKEIKKIVSEP